VDGCFLDLLNVVWLMILVSICYCCCGVFVLLLRLLIFAVLRFGLLVWVVVSPMCFVFVCVWLVHDCVVSGWLCCGVVFYLDSMCYSFGFVFVLGGLGLVSCCLL